MDTVRRATNFIRTDGVVCRARRGRRTHTEGVGIMVSKEAQRALISLEAVSARMNTAKIHHKSEQDQDEHHSVLRPHE